MTAPEQAKNEKASNWGCLATSAAQAVGAWRHSIAAAVVGPFVVDLRTLAGDVGIPQGDEGDKRFLRLADSGHGVRLRLWLGGDTQDCHERHQYDRVGVGALTR